MFLFLAPIVYALIGYPVLRILRKAGYSGWWSLVCVLPPLNLIALWIFAFSEWPNLPTQVSEFD
jgi:hypothetical protein